MSDTLFLAHRTPFPPNRGDRIRSWHLLCGIAKREPVHLIAFGEGFVPPELSAICASVRLVPHRRGKPAAAMASLLSGRPASVEFFRDPAFQSAVDNCFSRAFIRQIYCFSGQMAAYLPDQHNSQVYLDFVDRDSGKFEDLSSITSGPQALALRREARLLRRFEGRAAQKADTLLFISDDEADDFVAHHPSIKDKVHVVPNGVDLTYFRPITSSDTAAKGTADILFLGQMDYAPNVDAVCHFAEFVMPKLRRAGANVRFRIVGRAPDERVISLASAEDILVEGEVADVRPWLARADVVVAPLRVARGVQNKVLEAMAMARPVVLTPVAAQGINLVDGRDAVLAQDAEMQAAAILSLLANPARARMLGSAARAFVEKRFDWEAVSAHLADLMLAPTAQCAA